MSFSRTRRGSETRGNSLTQLPQGKEGVGGVFQGGGGTGGVAEVRHRCSRRGEGVQVVWQESDTGASADGLGVFLGQLLTHWLLILEAWYLVLGTFAPAWGARSTPWGLQDLLAPAPEGPEGAEMGFLERAMNR